MMNDRPITWVQFVSGNKMRLTENDGKCRSWTAGRVFLQGFWQGFFWGDLAPRKMKGWMERRVFLRDAMHHKYWPQPPETSSILPDQVVDGNCNGNLHLKQIRLIDQVLSITWDITHHPKVVAVGLQGYDSDMPPSWNTDSIYPKETLKSAFYLN